MTFTPTKFDTLLVANRGEIACRVMRTARRMGLKTVAVYSDADATARHVREADEAVRLGPAAARESYLSVDAVIEAAQRTGTGAIHPGYGFLSENGTFVKALEQAGITFVGPPASAIAAMGDKSAAKARMANAGVPLVPGYHGDDQGDALLRSEADKIGYPVMLKASAGGGGKGMRVVESGEGFQAALDGCRRESKAAFGDDRMLIEKYLVQPRHVEVQVFCDRYGNGVYLFERDCSVQRRHQKVIEEAPAPGMTPELRAAMGDAAVRAAQEIGYVDAGTVEFLLDSSPGQDGAFYFMEMNTRLQVEHPVTEMITGQDLVEWQLRVAMGEPLPCRQDELTITGHSFEARIYAEDPEQDFLPATGLLTRFALDLEGAGLGADQVRLDSGVESGDTVSMHYDPMLAKLIVHGVDRDAALATLNRALAALDVQGVVTNRAFLQRLANHPGFKNVELDTRFIERNEATLFAPRQFSTEDYASAALIGLHQLAQECESDSPWGRHDGFRLNAPHTIRIALCDPASAQAADNDSAVVVVEGKRATLDTQWQLTIGNSTLTASLQPLEGDAVAVTLNGHRRRLQAYKDGHVVVMAEPSGEIRLFWRRIDAIDHGHHEAESTLTAPMNGTVVALLVEPGAQVEKGMPLMVMEAMKMEHTMTAPADGSVETFHFQAGDTVGQGDVLLDFAPSE
ncbi:biotin carboxylase subunit of acetyl-CoA carboxylase [Vreelandella aquamarina]|jgi:3-methylcrotonyl-CoA carboxylase alpha subunit|uniref:Biotin carboxylase n=1 Tax=Vreelandella aquamarina TaxID=77097 RepID=A0A1N6GGN1_9GAMM|nr:MULTISPECIES: acetyl/propionyl/methylcrotonyl-CoA carboxylase subunit alpha [Halomonas]SEN09036.1 3-methylcrotonoyl-CoA carboxylase, alpha subunit [Halomonas aquamarina]SIN60393.1 3-methylcrotonoyl-CoA carboxylase, alpha subunit [Halomonas meridiana]SIN64769.1 3-methylcrotonoyl-CoA carboxylase, alpha subunit [Halomonas meridiana]SIO06656.1 3-methylcrotonoyl-CoA carboxylase, alpha subunit [Halomonas meridiana]GED44456.1 biotin carboxylase subunit of acetyl-CoA carboxylase [Halomonas meridian